MDKALIQGTSHSWLQPPKVSDSGQETTAANGWTAKCYLRTTSNTGLNLTGTDESGQWRFTLTASTSATLPAGKWFIQTFASKGEENILLDSGTLTLQASAAYTGLPTAFDGRSKAEALLDKVEDAIEAMITGGAVAEFSIGNRSVKSIPMGELLSLRSRLRNEVLRERAARGEVVHRNLKARFF